MSLVVFENQGVIDPRSISAFGVSVKESENPIGYFGTGMKYALSILLRTKHKVTIKAGNEVYRFGLKHENIRGKEFEFITMNDQSLSFTTELGKNWELWQAFREIYCNCLDEGGEVYDQVLAPKPQENKTFVVVEGRQFKHFYHMRDSIVLNLPESKALKVGNVNIFKNANEYIYYRGIRVFKTEYKTMLTYNINEETELTEDRTLKYPSHINSKIMKSVAGIKERDVIREVLTAERGWFEHEIDFGSLDWWEECISEEFVEVLGKEYHFNNDKLNNTARAYFVKRMNKQAAKNYQEIKLTTVERKQLDRCLDICKRLFTDFDMFEVMVVKTLGQETMAVADMNMRKIVLSRRSFELGTKFLLSTMIEEYAHLKTGYSDHSRQLQTWLFDQICGIVENHVIMEPV